MDACPGPFGVQRNDFIFFIDMVVTTDLDQIRDDFLLNTLQFPLVFLLIGRRASAIIQNDIKGQTALDHLYHSFIVFPTFKSALRANHKQDDMAVVHIFIRFHLMLDRRVNARSIHEDIFSCIIRLGFGRSGTVPHFCNLFSAEYVDQRTLSGVVDAVHKDLGLLFLQQAKDFFVYLLFHRSFKTLGKALIVLDFSQKSSGDAFHLSDLIFCCSIYLLHHFTNFLLFPVYNLFYNINYSISASSLQA